MLKEVPESMEELKRKATNQSNWRERLEAVNELKNYDCEQSRSILTNLAIHDSVFVVQEAAFRAAQSMKITKNGQPIRLNRKPKGNLVKGMVPSSIMRKFIYKSGRTQSAQGRETCP